jgi:hypothetical protein
VLIPKKNDPAELKYFRPISLCNVIFKVASKCLVNRLRPHLQDIIAPMQSAFIQGRIITDNVLIAFECIHAIQMGPATHRKFCAYKLDMAKGYDCVDWRFLEVVLAKLGFRSQWVQWVMACVNIVCCTIHFNGVTPSRGNAGKSSLRAVRLVFQFFALDNFLSFYHCDYSRKAYLGSLKRLKRIYNF